MMAPRTVTFKSVLHALATQIGMDPETQLQRNQAAALTSHINEAYQVCWDAHPWPESLVIEERTVTDRLVPWTQTDKEALGMVNSVWTEHPLTSTTARKIPYSIGPAGAYLTCDPATAWVVYRPEAPVFSADPWTANASYAVGDVCYHTDGHCYAALVASQGTSPEDATKWRQRPILKILQTATVAYAKGLQRDEDGQPETAMLSTQKADALIFQQITILHNQMGQTLYTKLVN